MIRLFQTLALALLVGGTLSAARFAEAADTPTQKDLPVAAVKTAAPPASAAPININTATTKELTALNGVGDKLATAIVDYRTKNGPFKSVDDLKKVKGVGEKKFAAIKPLIVVQ